MVSWNEVTETQMTIAPFQNQSWKIILRCECPNRVDKNHKHLGSNSFAIVGWFISSELTWWVKVFSYHITNHIICIFLCNFIILLSADNRSWIPLPDHPSWRTTSFKSLFKQTTHSMLIVLHCRICQLTWCLQVLLVIFTSVTYWWYADYSL